jgi:hypothetical protein
MCKIAISKDDISSKIGLFIQYAQTQEGAHIEGAIEIAKQIGNIGFLLCVDIKALKQGANIIFYIEEDNQILALAKCSHTGNGTLNLDDIASNTPGKGGLLIGYIINQCRKTAVISKITLSAASHDEKLIAYYNKFGFSGVGTSGVLSLSV